MSGSTDGRDPLLRRARVGAAVVFTGLSIILVLAQIAGRWFLGPTFDVGDLAFGGVFGTLIALVGVPAVISYVNRGDQK